MKNIRMRFTALFVVTLISLSAILGFTQSPGEKSKGKSFPATKLDAAQVKADKAWDNLGQESEPSAPIDGIATYGEAYEKLKGGSPEMLAWLNKVRLRYREEGLKFWKQFPNDPRRFVWLTRTISSAPYYWKDWEKGSRTSEPDLAPVDEGVQGAWDRTYMLLRAEFMASHDIADLRGLDFPMTQLRHDLRMTELFENYRRIKRLAMLRNEKPDLNHITNRFLDLAPHASEYPTNLVATYLLREAGEDAVAEATFLEAMKLNPRKELRSFAKGREAVAKLRSTPMELQTTTMTGKKLSLAELRGKVVLVYIWSNWCPSCMEWMPTIQAAYDKYRDRGFEVVGVWLPHDDAKERPDAIRYLSEKRATWPNGVLAGPAREEFMERYALIGVPHTFLLDQSGKLAATNVHHGPKFDEHVKRVLGL